MAEIIYSSLSCDSVNLGKIHMLVLLSDMTDKSIQFCTYENNILKINFESSLSIGDKTKLDTIVSNCLDCPCSPKDRIDIMKDICETATPDQLVRLNAFFNANSLLEIYLEVEKWNEARALIVYEFGLGNIIEGDKDFLLGIIPEIILS